MAHRHHAPPTRENRSKTPAPGTRQPSQTADERNLVLSGVSDIRIEPDSGEQRPQADERPFVPPDNPDHMKGDIHGQTGKSTPTFAGGNPSSITLRTPDGRAWVWEADLVGFALAYMECERAVELGHARPALRPSDDDLPIGVPATLQAHPTERDRVYYGPLRDEDGLYPGMPVVLARHQMWTDHARLIFPDDLDGALVPWEHLQPRPGYRLATATVKVDTWGFERGEPVTILHWERWDEDDKGIVLVESMSRRRPRAFLPRSDVSP